MGDGLPVHFHFTIRAAVAEMTETKASPVRPTAERIAQGGVIENPEERGGKPKPWWTFESPHDGLLAAGMITKQAWEAADKFKKAWTVAQGTGCSAGSMEPRVDGGRGGDISKAYLVANQELNNWSKMLAPEIYRCLVSVVGSGEHPTVWASAAKWHPATARVFLCTSMEQLALISGAKR